MNFWSLYRKDLRQLLMPMLFLLLAGLGWHGFWVYQSAEIPKAEFKLIISFIFPLLILPITLIWFGYRSFRNEWKQNTIYTLLSLPCSGRRLIGSKILAAFTYYLTVILLQTLVIISTYQVSISSGIKILERKLQVSAPLLLITMLFFLLLWGSYLYLLAQFSYLVSKLWDKFNLAVSIAAFLVMNYLLDKIAQLLAPAFNWLPSLFYLSAQEADGIINFSLNIESSGELAVWLLLLIGIYWLNGWLLENRLDV